MQVVLSSDKVQMRMNPIVHICFEFPDGVQTLEELNLLCGMRGCQHCIIFVRALDRGVRDETRGKG